MKIIKRDGREVAFDIGKIVRAIKGANSDAEERFRLTDNEIINIANSVTKKCMEYGRPITVEEVHTLVEDELMAQNSEVARKYIRYRYQKEIDRKQNTTDARILSVVDLKNADVLEENNNKNPIIIPTQIDYIA